MRGRGGLTRWPELPNNRDREIDETERQNATERENEGGRIYLWQSSAELVVGSQQSGGEVAVDHGGHRENGQRTRVGVFSQ